jgi:hypothetical protein
MPPEQGRRGDEEGDPAVTRQDATRRREQDPVDRPQPGWAGRPLQYPELVAENEDLEVLGSVLALLATADEETDEGAGDEVEERPHRPIVPGPSERESGFPIPTPSPPPDDALTASVGRWRRRALGQIQRRVLRNELPPAF